MSVPDRRLRLDARNLLSQPGLARAVEVDLVKDDLGVDDERIIGPIAVRLVATSNLDGIVVRGTIEVPWRAACRRCLAELVGSSVVDVDELYQPVASSGARQMSGPSIRDDAFPIEGDQVDLQPAVRETVLLEVPDDVLCAEECAGICPRCGADRNTAPCRCEAVLRDDRWAVLDELRGDGA